MSLWVFFFLLTVSRATYIRNAGTGESEKPVGIVALQDPEHGCRSGEREARSTTGRHQLEVEHLLSLLLLIVPDLHHEGLLSLVLPVAQVARDAAQVAFRRPSVELVDVTVVQLGLVQANVLQQACVPPLTLRV